MLAGLNCLSRRACLKILPVRCPEQEMDLLVEEEFLDVLVSLARHLPMHDIWQSAQRPPAGHGGGCGDAARP